MENKLKFHYINPLNCQLLIFTKLSSQNKLSIYLRLAALVRSYFFICSVGTLKRSENNMVLYEKIRKKWKES